MNKVKVAKCYIREDILSSHKVEIGSVFHSVVDRDIGFVESDMDHILPKLESLNKEDVELLLKYLAYEFSKENLRDKNLNIQQSDLLETMTQNHVNLIQFDVPQYLNIGAE
mgnify:CR=1 FL=1